MTYTADIHYYLTTEFDYAKTRFSPCTWRCWVTTVWIYKDLYGENRYRHCSWKFDIFCNKNYLPQCLVVFFIFISFVSSIRNLLREFCNTTLHYARWESRFHVINLGRYVIVDVLSTDIKLPSNMIHIQRNSEQTTVSKSLERAHSPWFAFKTPHISKFS